MKSKHIQIISVIIFAILAFVYLHSGDNTGMFGSLIMAKLCAMQFAIEDWKEKRNENRKS